MPTGTNTLNWCLRPSTSLGRSTVSIYLTNLPRPWSGMGVKAGLGPEDTESKMVSMKQNPNDEQTVSMSDVKIYRWTGACGLASIALFLVEFPLYFLRGPMPSFEAATKLDAYATRNATNMLTVIFLDMVIYCLVLVFLAGFRHLVRQARPECEWLGTLVFGVGLVYTTLTLVADS